MTSQFKAQNCQFGTIHFEGATARFVAAPKTDWFFHPDGTLQQENVPQLVATVDEPVFSLTAKVRVDFKSSYDAGALFVRTARDQWGKIAFEFSPDSIPTIVSVVTRGTSDDCDGPRHPADFVYLRAYVDEMTFAFHFSEDGKRWRFLRWFKLDRSKTSPIEIGLSGQSPTGEGCTSEISEIKLSFERISNLRDGQ